GIKLFRTAGAFTEPVSDTTLAMILSFVRNIIPNNEILSSGGWDKPQGFCLREKIIGLIGFGDIGRAVAKKIGPFGSKVKVYDIRNFGTAIYNEHNIVKADLDEIFSSCDIISLH